MGLIRTYVRAIGLLGSERWLVWGLVLLNAFIAVVSLAEPVLFGAVIDAIGARRPAFWLIVVWAVLGLGSIVASVLVALHADRLAHRQRTVAMGRAFEQAITLPISYHAWQGSGRVVRNILSGTDNLFLLWLGFFREHLAAMVGVVLLVPTALALDPRLAGLLGALAALYLTVNVFVVRRTEAGQKRVDQHHADVFGRVGDVLGNVTVVQSYARLTDEAAALRDLFRRLLDVQYPVLAWWALLTMFTRGAATAVMVVVLAVGSLLAARGEVSVGEIVAFIGFANLLVGRLDQLAQFVGRFFSQAPTLDAFYELLEAKGKVTDAPGARPLEVTAGRVVFDGATFRFPNSHEGVFDLSFTAEAGQTVALVGPTGSGKTTTLALLQRLRDLDGGTIAIDGADIRGVTLASLRHSMAVVFQDAGLFNRSIRDNLLIGRPGATEAEIVEAARQAEAHEFIMRKPGGYDFVIGERGQALSGGERQRLAIARALLKDAPILLLDEATSALDNATEARIKRALDAARRGRTTFVIAHRLTTIVDADLIVVLERGRLVEQGRFDELDRRGGAFARLVDLGKFTAPA